MKLSLTLEMDNDAFQHGKRRAEVGRILSRLIHEALSPRSLKTEGRFMDVNGNTVGHWNLTDFPVELVEQAAKQ